MALTAHFNASVSTRVFTTGTTQATDGQNVEQWDDVSDATDASLWFESTPPNGPTYRVTTPLMLLPCLDFNGSSEYLNSRDDANLLYKTMSDFFGASAKTVIMSVYVESATVNDANSYLNHRLFRDSAAYFGILVKNVSGVYKIIAYTWDGADKSVELTISLNTSYVVMVRHDGTNLFISLDGGAESSVAAGATSVMTGNLFFGGSGVFFDGRIGEVKLWNENLTGGTLATEIAYFTTRWLAGAAPPTNFFSRRVA